MIEQELSPTGGRRHRKTLAIGLTLILLFGTLLATRRLIFDWHNIPLCHKHAWVQVEAWWFLNRLRELPNVEGHSIESLGKLNQDDAKSTDEWNGKYQYVPGLRRADPGDLVLLYMKHPTRWRHHAASPPWVFDEAKWVIVPLDFAGVFGPKDVALVKREIPNEGEGSERVSLEEFKGRLRKTLKFLQENNRPHWQTVLAEKEAFLESLESE